MDIFGCECYIGGPVRCRQKELKIQLKLEYIFQRVSFLSLKTQEMLNLELFSFSMIHLKNEVNN